MRRSTVAGSLLTVLAVGVLLRLAAWQWQRGSARGSLLNYTYAVEWALLAVALVVVVARRRSTRPDERDERSRDVHGGLIGPALRPGEQPPDPVSVRWQRRLRGPHGGR